jgi:NADH-quinone oxidoreductase subunit A
VIRSYLPAIVFLVLGLGVGVVFAIINSVIGPRRDIAAKGDPYECGLPSDVRRGFRFGISFYLIAMLFILFDIEVIFLFPVAMQLNAFGVFALVELSIFVVLLMVAFIYVWRRGALEWR